jgi:uncharacterized membrane protein YtjA (UPF0391 family)
MRPSIRSRGGQTQSIPQGSRLLHAIRRFPAAATIRDGGELRLNLRQCVQRDFSEAVMLSWGVAFLCIALIAAVEGFQPAGGPLAALVLAGACAGFVAAAVSAVLPRRPDRAGMGQPTRGTYFHDGTS